MSDTIIPGATTTSLAPPRARWLQLGFRAAVLARFGQLERGRIVLRDGESTQTFGVAAGEPTVGLQHSWRDRGVICAGQGAGRGLIFAPGPPL